MTLILWVSLGVLLIFLLGFSAGEGFETRASRARSKRLAARERKIRAWQREIDATLREIDAIEWSPA
jgi:hypothetical protein